MKFLILNSLDNHADLVRACKKNVAIVAGSARTVRFFQISPLKLVNSHLSMFVCVCMRARTQERIIERLKDQREREDRERLEEVDSYKKENKDLKEKVNSLQIELTEKEVSGNACGQCQSAARDFTLEHVLCVPLACCAVCVLHTATVLIACVVRPSAVQPHRLEGARVVAGVVRPEEGFQAQIAGDRHRAEKRGV